MCPSILWAALMLAPVEMPRLAAVNPNIHSYMALDRWDAFIAVLNDYVTRRVEARHRLDQTGTGGAVVGLGLLPAGLQRLGEWLSGDALAEHLPELLRLRAEQADDDHATILNLGC